MSDFKPEHETIPDPRDRHSGTSSRSAGTAQEPHINMQALDQADKEPDTLTMDASSPVQPALDFGTAADRLQPDASAGRKKIPQGKTFSRRHIVIGIAILVLLLIILGLAMNSPKPDQTSEKTITLPVLANNNNHDASPGDSHTRSADQQNQPDGILNQNNSQTLEKNTAPADTATIPVQDKPRTGDNPQGTTPLTSQPDLNNVLSAPMATNTSQPASPLPTQPARLEQGAKTQPVTTSVADKTSTTSQQAVVSHSREQQNTTTSQPVTPHTKTKQPAPAVVSKTSRHTPSHKNNESAAEKRSLSHSTTMSLNALKTAPPTHFTVQLSSATQSTGLLGLAKKEQLTNYVVYKTTRNNQPWYVLVSGIYSTREAAKHAITLLPAAVQAKKPWIKPLHQVQDDLRR